MTSTITVRLDDSLKREVDEVSKNLGVSTSTAFTIFAKQYVARRGFPFPVVEAHSRVERLDDAYDAMVDGEREYHSLIEM